MIAAIIARDHAAGQELFADAGNATQPAWDERGDSMGALARLWEEHGTLLERAVFPHLGGAGAESLVGTLRNQQRRVADLAHALSRRAADKGGDRHWLTDFEELKALFDAQCLCEMTELITHIGDRVAPDVMAEMTRQARALRRADRS